MTPNILKSLRNSSVLLRRGTGLGIAILAALVSQSKASAEMAVDVDLQNIRYIDEDATDYRGWPMLTRLDNGDLMLVYSGGRDYHICPFGRIDMIRSSDNGETWSEPMTLVDTPLDDRDPAVLQTSENGILVTYNCSSVYQKHMNDPQRLLAKVYGDELEANLERWKAQDALTTGDEKKAIQGQYRGFNAVRSTDGGKTWSKPFPIPGFSPRGPIRLSDGSLLHFSGLGEITWMSYDEGLTWEKVGKQNVPGGEDHAVQNADGSIVAHVRLKENTPQGRIQHTVQMRSDDSGQTWTDPRHIADGYPSHLLRLKDDSLLMTYGVRKAPYGIRARVSRDAGLTWSEELIISDDGASWDLGYPSTVELPDGRLLSIWYEVPEGQRNAGLRQAIWRLP